MKKVFQSKKNKLVFLLIGVIYIFSQCWEPPLPPIVVNCANSTQPSNGWFFGQWGDSQNWGYHIYTELRELDLTGFQSTDQITLIVHAQEVPNNFTLIDENNTIIVTTSGQQATSGWIGAVNYNPSPCLTGNVSLQSTAYITFTRGSHTKASLRIETCTPQNQADSWEAAFICPGVTIEDPCRQQIVSGYWDESIFHIYPDVPIDVTNVPNGSLLCLSLDCSEVPNNFQIIHNGQLMNTPHWMGPPNSQQVCWQSVSGTTRESISFTKQPGANTVIVKVITCPPLGQHDSWWVSLICCSNGGGGN